MATREVPIGNAFRYGWQQAIRYLGFFIVAMLLVAILGSLNSIFQQVVGEGNFTAVYFLLSIACFVFSLLFTLGFIRICLRVCDQQSPQFGDLFSQWGRLIAYFFSSILVGLCFLAGFILLIVPGILIALKFMFYGYFIVEEKAGPIEAMQRSWDVTRGHLLELFLFVLASIGINLLGMLACCIGLFVTYPLTQIAKAYVYRTLAAPDGREEQFQV
jgi:hypothetical protein